MLVTSFLYVRTRRSNAVNRVRTKTIYAAATDLPAGLPIRPENLAELTWPESVPLDGAVTSREDAVGHVLLYPLGAKEPLMKRALGAPESLGLASKIPDGMRAAAVKTTEVSNVGGFLFPGCKVDVLVSIRGNGNTTVARTVLQNVQVLATGRKTEADLTGKPESASKPNEVSIVTLLVTPQDSEKLFWAQQQGGMQLVLRNGTDQQKSTVPEITLAELTGAKVEPEAVTPAPRKVRKQVPRQVYLVETVAGSKTTVAKFEGKSE